MNIPNVLYRKNRILLRELTKTDFKLRYQGSVLGYLWALLRPLLMFAILYVVFAKLLRFGSDIPHYPVYLLTGTVLWSFFTECTTQGIQAMVHRGDLIRKIAFPKYIVVVSTTFTALINLAINLVVVILFALLNGVTPSWTWLLVPVLVLELYCLALGICFLLGAINVKFRDIASIWDVLIQALFYAVPIIYPVTMVASSSALAAKIILLNPIAQVIQDVRYSLITTESITGWSFLESPVLMAIPIVIVMVLELYCLALGICFLLGAINVKFRDIASIWDVLIQALFYAVPIIYPVTMVASSSALAAKIILLNPIAQVIQDVRYSLITTESITGWSFLESPVLMAIPIVIVMVILIWGSVYFRKQSKFFAEEI